MLKKDEKFSLVDHPSMRPVLLGFIENLPKIVERLRGALMHLDSEEMSTLSHQLSGSAGSYGLDQIGRIAAIIESNTINPMSSKVLLPLIDELDSLSQSAKREVSD
ncbi:MAG: Hpt domain-containing protein [Oligoflexales bacterium]|nr:Hpt domain-containing protein [Oligoflexales bacterium]